MSQNISLTLCLCICVCVCVLHVAHLIKTAQQKCKKHEEWTKHFGIKRRFRQGKVCECVKMNPAWSIQKSLTAAAGWKEPSCRCLCLCLSAATWDWSTYRGNVKRKIALTLRQNFTLLRQIKVPKHTVQWWWTATGRGEEKEERGEGGRGVTGQHSPNICHVCCLCMRHRLHIIKKSVKWPCEESKLCHSTAKLNQNQESQNYLTPFPPCLPTPPRCITTCHSAQCKLAYKPRFCHNLHIKLAQHFRRLPDWLPRCPLNPFLPLPPCPCPCPLCVPTVHRLLLLLVTLGSRLGLI